MDHTGIPAWQWEYILLIPEFGRYRQVDVYEFEASQDYRMSSRTAVLHRETLS